MLDIRNLTKQTLEKYNLEIIAFDISNDDEFFVQIQGSSWWVFGIDEENNILYVENDGDGIFHNLDGYSIDDLEENDYILLGRQKEYIPGMISTRSISDPITDVKDFIEAGTVYRIKYIGPDTSI